MRKSFIIGFAAIALLLAGLFAQERSRAQIRHRNVANHVSIYVYPEELTGRDQLTDGDTERLFRLHDNTLLIWVDLEPGLFFTHPTAYILISAQGVRFEQGNWWPVLNGQTILYEQQNRVPVISPFQIQSSNGPVDVYFYPEALSAANRISDGNDIPIPLESNTFLAWIDLHPELRFTHPTTYVLVGSDKSIRILDGGWWPELNGKTVLYGSRNKYGIESPFDLLHWAWR